MCKNFLRDLDLIAPRAEFSFHERTRQTSTLGGLFSLMMMICAISGILVFICKIVTEENFTVTEHSVFRAVNATHPNLPHADNNMTFPALTLTFTSEEALEKGDIFDTISQYYDFLIDTVNETDIKMIENCPALVDNTDLLKRTGLMTF
jgi:hypothetical protein